MSYYNNKICSCPDNQGFTFLEILVVVALIAIFSVICINGYFGLVVRQRVKDTVKQMELIITAAKEFRTRNTAHATVNNLPDTNSINVEYNLVLESEYFNYSINFNQPDPIIFIITATLNQDMSSGVGKIISQNSILTYTLRTNDVDPWGGSAELLKLK